MLLAVGVVQMLASRKDLDCLRAAAHQAVQQTGMQPLLHVNVRRHCLEHQYPTAFPLFLPSLAPKRSPVFWSTAMHSPSLQYGYDSPATVSPISTLYPICSSDFVASG